MQSSWNAVLGAISSGVIMECKWELKGRCRIKFLKVIWSRVGGKIDRPKAGRRIQ